MSIRWCNGCGSYHLHGQHTTASPFRPAAPVVQGADELREAIAQAVATAGDGYWARADAVLALPEVARLLTERDQAQAKVARARRLCADVEDGWDPSVTRFTEALRRALDGSA